MDKSAAPARSSLWHSMPGAPYPRNTRQPPKDNTTLQMLPKPTGKLSSLGRGCAVRQACQGILPPPYQFICHFISLFVCCGAGGVMVLVPPAAQHRSLRRGPRLSFPNRWWRGTPGDLTSFLSKNNRWALGSTKGKGRERDAGQRELTKRSPTRHLRLPCQSWGDWRGVPALAMMSQGTSSVDVPGEGSQLPAVPGSTLLD